MKINAPGLEQYQKYVKAVKSGESSAAKTKSGAVFSENTDKVTISQDAALRAEAGRLSAGVTAEVEDSAAPARLEALREAVQGGGYSVPAEDVANAILDRLV